MTDKQIIYNCPHISLTDWGTYTCKLYNPRDKNCLVKGGNCASNTNCPYKLEEDLKAKEQECEELKEKFQDMKKSRDVALKEYNEEFEYKRQITVEHLEQKKELLTQLDQLKIENEELKKDYTTAKSMYGLCQSDFMELAKIKDKYKQTLAEIKEIAEPFCNACLEFELEKNCNNCIYCNYGNILQKISEVENGV